MLYKKKINKKSATFRRFSFEIAFDVKLRIRFHRSPRAANS